MVRGCWPVLLSLCSAAAYSQEVDFSGQWQPLFHEDGPERIPGPDLGDYSGIPINEAARMRGDSYDPNRISVVMEYQCRQHGADYSMRAFAHMRVMRELDPVTQQAVAFHTRLGAYNMSRTIYLDGRPHPPANAPHTFQGFSTGTWKANRLVIKTTHLKESYLRRNGLPASSERTFTESWVRHGDYLTVVTIIEDPAFLTERLVRSQNWVLDPGQRTSSDPCEYVPEVPVSTRPVPHYLPGQNPFTSEFADRFGLPLQGVRGGAQTLYPEYRLKMDKPAKSPEHCPIYCTCMNQGLSCPEHEPSAARSP